MARIDLDQVAKRAVQIHDTEKVSAGEAVVRALSGTGASKEHVHRVCTKVNRDLLHREKNSTSPSDRWSVRFETAKPEEVLPRLGHTKASSMKVNPLLLTPSTEDERASRMEFALQKLSSRIPQSYREKVSSETEMLQRHKDFDSALVDMRVKLSQVKDLHRRAQAKATASEMELNVKRDLLVNEIQRTAKTSGFSWGEILHGVKREFSIDGHPDLDSEFDLVCDALIKKSGYPVEAHQGEYRDSRGELVDRLNRPAQALWSVREKVSSAPMNPSSAIYSAAREWSDAVIERYAAEEVRREFSEQVTEMSGLMLSARG